MTRSGISTAAWDQAVFGTHGFYSRAETNPALHFRTSAHIGGPLIELLAGLANEVDACLGHPQVFDLVDVGCGGGELISALVDYLEIHSPSLACRTRSIAIDLRPRPVDFNSAIEWICDSASRAIPADVTGLVLAFELLDDVPTDLGPGSASSTRTELAVAIAERVADGSVLFVDYTASTSDASLSSYRNGRQVTPIADGTANLTAPVDFDLLESALSNSGKVSRARQSQIFQSWQPQTERLTKIEQLQCASQVSELTNERGLGAHEWLRLDVGARIKDDN